MRIRHEHARDIDIQGSEGSIVPTVITFDYPHDPAGTLLHGQYPLGVIDWGEEQWKVHTPDGAFGTFSIAIADPRQEAVGFRFYSPRTIIGVDIYNGDAKEAEVTISCPELHAMTWKLPPHEVRRVRTGWQDSCSSVSLETKHGEHFQFDNFAYSLP